MPIALVQSAQTNVSGVNNTTRAFASNVTAGNLLGASIVTFQSTAGTTITTPTDTLVHTYQPAVAQQDHSGDTVHLRSWFVPNCIGGADTVTADISGVGTGEITAIIYELSGIDTSSPLSGTPVLFGPTVTANPSTGVITPADNGCILIGVLNAGGAPITITPASGWTTIQEYEGASVTVTLSVIYKIQTTATPEAASWTLSGSPTCVAHLFALKPAAGAGGTVLFNRLALVGHGR